MDKDGVLRLARELIYLHPGTLNDTEGYLKHLAVTYDIASTITGRIIDSNPGIPLDRAEIALAAGLHDIGRPLRKDQLFHELRGADFIQEIGLEMGIAQTYEDVYRMAQMIRSHGFVYERWNLNPKPRVKFAVDPSLLLPATWQEAIVTYADDHNDSGERVDIHEKFRRQLQRYNGEFHDDGVVQSIMEGPKRVTELCKRVDALAHGELSASEISVYGFL